MNSIQTIFLGFAFACFVIAAFKAFVVPTVKIDFVALGFAFVVLVFLLK